MSAAQVDVPGPVELEQAVRRRITRWTAGRIRDLEVAVTAGRVEIRGRARSFHLKQLAISGVLEEIESWGTGRPVEIDVRITVAPAESNAVV